MKKALMFLAVLPVIASAQISEGADTLLMNHGVNLNTGIQISSQPQAECFYPCSTIITSVDLISLTNIIPVCYCACTEGYAIGTPRPFYIAKQQFTGMDLSKPLNLNDTALFSKVDTVESTQGCIPVIGTVSGTVNSACLLPYEEAENYGTEQVFVLETARQKYAMVRVTPFTNPIPLICSIGAPDTSYANGGTALHWYIQNNGTLDFSGVNQSAVLPHDAHLSLKVASQNRRYRIGLASGITNRLISEVYTLEGKRIDAWALKKMNALVIYR
jgi:hypothetical protein